MENVIDTEAIIVLLELAQQNTNYGMANYDGDDGASFSSFKWQVVICYHPSLSPTIFQGVIMTDKPLPKDTKEWLEDLDYSSRYIVLPATIEEAVAYFIEYHLARLREHTQIELNRHLTLRMGRQNYGSLYNKFKRMTEEVDRRTRKYRDMDADFWEDGKWLTGLNKSVHIIDYNLINLAERLDNALQEREFKVKGHKYEKVEVSTYNSGKWPPGFVTKIVYRDGLPKNWITAEDKIYLLEGSRRIIG